MFMNGASQLKDSVRTRVLSQQAQINADLAEAYERLEREQDHGLATQDTSNLIDRLVLALRGTERLLAKAKPTY